MCRCCRAKVCRAGNSRDVLELLCAVGLDIPVDQEDGTYGDRRGVRVAQPHSIENLVLIDYAAAGIQRFHPNVGVNGWVVDDVILAHLHTDVGDSVCPRSAEDQYIDDGVVTRNDDAALV